MAAERTKRKLLGVMLLGCVTPLHAHASAGSPAIRRSETTALAWPRAEVLRLAVRAYDCARSFFSGSLLTVIDYTLPSTARRLWVIDLTARRVLFNELVAHGVGSGENYAATFSNRPGSRQSSLGLFRTEDTFQGEQGESLRLTGLETGVNDRAMERAIVMHCAPYVSTAVASARGLLGRSWGCPALEPGVGRRVIERVKGGTALFAYYPDPQWLAASRFLRCDDRVGAAPVSADRTVRR
jgi:hypothetical protein